MFEQEPEKKSASSRAVNSKVPEGFEKIIGDFVTDLKTTFPEYSVFLEKWWKDESYFTKNFSDETERKEAFRISREKSTQFIFKFLLKKLPQRFFEILYQSGDIFQEDSEVDTEFLPQIHFKNLWNLDISDKTKETIWKYLQLIMFSIVGRLEKTEDFGETTAKLFQNINQDEFKEKLEKTLNDIQTIFEKDENSGSENTNTNESTGTGPFPNAEDIHSHISGMMDGKLGQLAKEIAEETAQDLNLDMENVSSAQDVFKKMFQNPTKMMNLVKNVGEKLDTKLKSGEIKESELIAEASAMVSKMKNMPGMGNIQEMLSQMGIPAGMAKGGKMNFGAMQEQLNSKMRSAKTKERMRENVAKKQAEAQMQAQTQAYAQPQAPAMTDDELIALMNQSQGKETLPNNNNNKKNKKKKKN